MAPLVDTEVAVGSEVAETGVAEAAARARAASVPKEVGAMAAVTMVAAAVVVACSMASLVDTAVAEGSEVADWEAWGLVAAG
jgi:hypothetical protein